MKSHYTWLDGYKLVEPYRNTTFRISSVRPSPFVFFVVDILV